MSRVGLLLRKYGFDVLIVIAAIEMAFEVALKYGAPTGPTTPKWFAATAAALIALPLLARRRFPFAAPVSVWVLAAALSFVDGRLVGFTTTASVIGLVFFEPAIAEMLASPVPGAVAARLGALDQKQFVARDAEDPS